MLRSFFVSVSLIAWAILFCDNCVDGAMSMEKLRNFVKPVRNGCIEKIGVDTVLLNGMPKGEFPNDKTLRCYTKCVMDAFRTMKDGKPLLKAVLQQIKFGMPKDMQARSNEVAKYCCETLDYDDDPCTAAWQFVKCTYEQNPEGFFFP